MPQKKAKGKTEKKVSAERVPSGIPGLDRFMEGGILKGSANLLAGSTGTGKTIFCLQFLLEGLRRGEKCMFLTFEEVPEDIMGDVKAFGWELDKYLKNGQLILEYRDPFELTDTAKLCEKIKCTNVSRLALDSTSTLGLYFKDPFDVRKHLFKLLAAIKKSGVTTLLTTEMPEADKALSRFGVEEYITDSVIVLNYLDYAAGADFARSLLIRKMRRTDHGKDVYPLEITKGGIVVKSPTEALKS